jgi:hypothetical protein
MTWDTNFRLLGTMMSYLIAAVTFASVVVSGDAAPNDTPDTAVVVPSTSCPASYYNTIPALTEFQTA